MPSKNSFCMDRLSKTVMVAPFRPPDPNSTKPVILASMTGGWPGVASLTLSPIVKCPFSAASTSRAIWSGPVG